MENMLEKSFKNEAVGFELTSYIDKQQNVWFRAKEIAEILGYSNIRQTISRHVDSEDKKLICWRPHSVKETKPGVTDCDGRYQTQNRYYTFVNESGFYSLVLSSKLICACKKVQTLGYLRNSSICAKIWLF